MKHNRQKEAESAAEETLESLRELQVPAPSPEKMEAVVEQAVAGFKNDHASKGRSVH